MTTHAPAGSLQLAEHGRNVWKVDLAATFPPDDVVNPEFWKNEARKIRQWDRIEVRWEGGKHWRDLLVTSSGKFHACVHVLLSMDKADAAEVAEDAPLSLTYVKWGSPSVKYRVHRKSDHEVVSQHHETDIAAMAAAAQYEKTVATA